jgi:alkylation response protein AidB-like acyl-CoA dehydrogenase
MTAHDKGSAIMDFALTPEQEQFGNDFRTYLKTAMTPELNQEMEEMGEYGGPVSRAFFRKLGSDGWLGVGWPKEYGGQGRSPMEQYIFFEIAAYAGAPLPMLALNTVGPTIMKYGSEDLKNLVLPRILKGEIEICIGYSEPDAGTDLASLASTAVLDGDEYVLNGQKSFTSCAHFADYIWFAARTDPTVKKHKGISLFLLDIDTPGIEITPVYTVGGVQTNSTFYDDVRVPKSRLVGEENQAWKYMTAQLDLERIALCPASPLTHRLEEAAAWARETKMDGSAVMDKPGVRHKFAEMTAKVEVLKLLNFQVAERLTQGLHVYAEASTVKAYGSDLYQEVNNTLMEIMGPFGQLELKSPWAPLDGLMPGFYRRDLVLIFGGGAIEVQKNIIAMAGLFMPRSM